jgi:hypothetical protein
MSTEVGALWRSSLNAFNFQLRPAHRCRFEAEHAQALPSTVHAALSRMWVARSWPGRRPLYTLALKSDASIRKRPYTSQWPGLFSADRHLSYRLVLTKALVAVKWPSETSHSRFRNGYLTITAVSTTYRTSKRCHESRNAAHGDIPANPTCLF